MVVAVAGHNPDAEVGGCWDCLDRRDQLRLEPLVAPV